MSNHVTPQKDGSIPHNGACGVCGNTVAESTLQCEHCKAIWGFTSQCSPESESYLKALWVLVGAILILGIIFFSVSHALQFILVFFYFFIIPVLIGGCIRCLIGARTHKPIKSEHRWFSLEEAESAKQSARNQAWDKY